MTNRTPESDPRVDRIDYQARSVWLRNGDRIGFATARRTLGLDV